MRKLPKVPNLTDLAYLSVKQHLLDGSITEGSRLTEESLASQLGISKSPVREALTRLESEGLVNIESRRGAYVRKFTLEETRELFDMRELLEVYAVGAAEITPQLLTDLEQSIEQTRKHLAEGNKVAHVEEDMHFHGLIAAATGNQELCRILENIQHKNLLCRAKSYHLSSATAPVSHNKIYQALKVGDKVAAQEAMREHILFVRARLLASIDEATEAAATAEPATDESGLAATEPRA